jgi:ribosomal-protein-serine acetyltransferase
VFRLALSDGRWLRLLEDSDARELHTAIEANREHLARWMPWAADQTLASTLAFIARARRQLGDNDGFQAVVVEAGRIVGVIGYHSVCWRDRSTSLGYWLTERAQGRGTMTLAVRSLMDHAFETWRLNRVEIRAGLENARSLAVAERLGFTQQGVSRAAELIGGRYIDQAVYAMLASDWAARHGHRWGPRIGPDLGSRGVDCRPNPPERDSG